MSLKEAWRTTSRDYFARVVSTRNKRTMAYCVFVGVMVMTIEGAAVLFAVVSVVQQSLRRGTERGVGNY